MNPVLPTTNQFYNDDVTLFSCLIRFSTYLKAAAYCVVS